MPPQINIAAVCLCVMLMIGCGFQPLMGRSSDEAAPSEELRRIRVLVIADRSGQILRNQLLDDLRTSSNLASLYTMEVRLVEPRHDIAIRRDESASRVAYSANANFTLRNSAGQPLLSGASSSSSTYEATTSEFASIAGARGARDRAMQEISADIREQLAAYFYKRARNPEPYAPPSVGR